MSLYCSLLGLNLNVRDVRQERTLSKQSRLFVGDFQWQNTEVKEEFQREDGSGCTGSKDSFCTEKIKHSCLYWGSARTTQFQVVKLVETICCYCACFIQIDAWSDLMREFRKSTHILCLLGVQQALATRQRRLWIAFSSHVPTVVLRSDLCLI